jgi:hypothetical protein
MRGGGGPTRRGFFAAAGGAAALALGASEPARAPRIRVGSVVWNLRGIGAGPPWDEAIRATAELGFEGIELIAAGAEELDAYWREPELARLKALLAELRLECPQFVLFQNAVAGLGSRERAARAGALGARAEGAPPAGRAGRARGGAGGLSEGLRRGAGAWRGHDQHRGAVARRDQGSPGVPAALLRDR